MKKTKKNGEFQLQGKKFHFVIMIIALFFKTVRA